MTDRETRVREIAYQMWEQEGFPEGKHDAHWYEAEAVYDAEVAGGVLKPNSPDEMALSETAVARASSSVGKPQRSGGKAKSMEAMRDARPANQNIPSEDNKPSSAKTR